jgi:2-phosphoglycerate kinase
MSRRLLLVGGSAGTGKSTAAQTVATRMGAAWLQLDTLWIVMHDAAPRDSEERRRLDIDRKIREQAEPAETLLAHHIAASAFVCAALPHALAFELQTHPIVVADGAWLLPDFAGGLELADVDIASVFLHESDHGALDRAMASRRDIAMVAPWHAESVRLAWLYGNWLADQARAASFPVVAARPYETAPDRVLAVARMLPQG